MISAVDVQKMGYCRKIILSEYTIGVKQCTTNICKYKNKFALVSIDSWTFESVTRFVVVENANENFFIVYFYFWCTVEQVKIIEYKLFDVLSHR